MSYGQGYPAKLGIPYAVADVLPTLTVQGPVASTSIGLGTNAIYAEDSLQPSDVVTAVAALVIGVAWFGFWPPLSALDQFWRPVWSSPHTVLLCVGQRPFLGSSPELPGKLDDDIARFAGKRPTPPRRPHSSSSTIWEVRTWPSPIC